MIAAVQSSIHSKSATTLNTITINTKCYGQIWEGGKYTNGFPKSDVGDVIICEADLGAGVLRWKRNGNPLKECAVPPQMKGKTAYLSIIMYDDGDEVEVSV